MNIKKSQLKALLTEIVKRVLLKEYTSTIRDPQTGEEVDVEVEYEYYRGHMGHRVGMARFAEPDEPAQVVITDITTADGRQIDPDDLDDNTRENLEQAIMDSHEGGYDH